MVYKQVNLQGIDPLLFGDNRMARAGEDHILSPQSPSPYTIFGAIGQYLIKILSAGDNLSNWDKNPDIKECLGEFIDESSPDEARTMELLAFVYQTPDGKFYFPAPRHFEIYERGQKYFALNLMTPKESPGKSNCPYTKILVGANKDSRKKVEADFLVDENALGKILINETPRRKIGVKFLSDIYKEEFRTGLMMKNTRNVTKVGHLFNRPYWRFLWDYDITRQEWTAQTISAWIRLLCEKELTGGDVGFLGGDRRRAEFVLKNIDEPPFVNLQNKVLANITSTDGFFIYLITPLPIQQELGQLKPLDRTPLAAAIGKPVYVSGWERTRNSNKQHPRPMLWAAPSGSIFFFEWEAEEKKDDEKKQCFIKENWLKSVAADKYKRFGFGRILIGVWKNGNSN